MYHASSQPSSKHITVAKRDTRRLIASMLRKGERETTALGLRTVSMHSVNDKYFSLTAVQQVLGIAVNTPIGGTLDQCTKSLTDSLDLII